jgi:predicted nucleic acid-binding protein
LLRKQLGQRQLAEVAANPRLTVEFPVAVKKSTRKPHNMSATEQAKIQWKRLVVRHSVLGSKVHDARLVATMNVHGIRRILTFNTADFARYDIEAVHPVSINGGTAPQT